MVGVPSLEDGVFKYDKCSQAQDPAGSDRFLPDPAIRQAVQSYRDKPARGPMAACVYKAQKEYAGPRVFCDGNHRFISDSQCHSQAMHRIMSNVYDDLTKCLGLDKKELASMLWQESGFVPYSRNNSSDAHGASHYRLNTLKAKCTNFEAFAAPIRNGGAACEQLNKIVQPIPVKDCPNHRAVGQDICLSTAYPQHMISNLAYAGLDYVKRRNEFTAMANAARTKLPPEAQRNAVATAALVGHFGPATSKDAFEGYLKARPGPGFTFATWLKQSGDKNNKDLADYLNQVSSRNPSVNECAR